VKALSIRQPWAWLIVNGHKDIENRGWYTPHRGDFLVHAGKAYGPRLHKEDQEFFMEGYGILLPPFADIPLGGIVGAARIIDCKRDLESRWYVEDSWGFVLTGMKTLPFQPLKGALGWFEVPPEYVGCVDK
jgi:hypothetical protein